jgi:Zn-dependent peptidase ImmA (M78 family)
MEELTYVGSATADISPRTLTARIREELGLSETWSDFGLRRADTNDAFSRLRSAAQGAGMIVIMSGVVGENTHRPLSADEFRAFALIDDYAPLIFINRDDSAHGRLFSLAHEIAHVWLGEEELYNDDHDSRVTNKLERLCNAVAAELLLPKSQTERAWEQVRRNGVEIEAVLDDFVRRFPVSIVTVARRALDAGLISQKSYESHVQEAKDHWDSLKEEGKSPGGGNYYNTKQSRVDHRILERLIASVDEGRTSYTEALRLTGTNRRTFPNLLERVGL